MGPDEKKKPDDLHRRWTERLGKWLRRPDTSEEQPTTAASKSMRENLEEPRE
jgi:hypothetical protein